METLSPSSSAQDAYGNALDTIVDRGTYTYDDARRILFGSSIEQAALTEAAQAPINGEGSLTVEQAADVLRWYQRRQALGRAAARITTDREITTASGDPLLTIHESAAAMNYLLKQK